MGLGWHPIYYWTTSQWFQINLASSMVSLSSTFWLAHHGPSSSKWHLGKTASPCSEVSYRSNTRRPVLLRSAAPENRWLWWCLDGTSAAAPQTLVGNIWQPPGAKSAMMHPIFAKGKIFTHQLSSTIINHHQTIINHHQPSNNHQTIIKQSSVWVKPLRTYQPE